MTPRLFSRKNRSKRSSARQQSRDAQNRRLILEPLEDRRLLASIGNFVWSDDNANGVQDSGEPGVPGVLVRLIGGGADFVIGTSDDTTSATTTDSNGFYQFGSLTPGTQYQVQFSVPSGYIVWTQANVGSDDTIDSDANQSSGRTPIVTLAAAEDNITLDAGLLRSLASIEGTLYYNLPGDVRQPVPGQTVSLHRDGDADGLYDGA
ncbi:MAG TPA: SdrD B-like domain-containing protein, partial [Candidatus Anammoximicrobium sp.]|nr:SdrD B-like domain-containing protein [Candidatus Anammoximicrobium sp.]